MIIQKKLLIDKLNIKILKLFILKIIKDINNIKIKLFINNKKFFINIILGILKIKFK